MMAEYSIVHACVYVCVHAQYQRLNLLSHICFRCTLSVEPSWGTHLVSSRGHPPFTKNHRGPFQEFSWLGFAVIPGCVETAKLGALGHVLTLLHVFLQPQMFPVWVNCLSRLASPG